MIGFIANKGGSGTDSSGKNQNYGIWITSSGKLSGGFETSSGSNKYVTSPNSYVDGQWQHGVVTFDGSNVRLYVNGIQVASTSTTSRSRYKVEINLCVLVQIHFRFQIYLKEI